MITPKQLFQSSTEKVKFIEAFINHPFGQEALLILAGEGTPNKPTPVSGVSYADLMSVSGAESIGWHRALHALKALAVLPPKPGEAEELQYVDLAKKELLATGLYTEAELNNLAANPTQ